MPAYWSLLSVTGPQFYRADSNTPRSVYFKIRQIAAVLEWRLHYKSLECKPEPLARYIEGIDALNKQRAWGSPIVSSWYKNDRGRVTQNWPGTHWEYWQETLEPDLSDFEVV